MSRGTRYNIKLYVRYFTKESKLYLTYITSCFIFLYLFSFKHYIADTTFSVQRLLAIEKRFVVFTQQLRSIK